MTWETKWPANPHAVADVNCNTPSATLLIVAKSTGKTLESNPKSWVVASCVFNPRQERSGRVVGTRGETSRTPPAAAEIAEIGRIEDFEPQISQMGTDRNSASEDLCKSVSSVVKPPLLGNLELKVKTFLHHPAGAGFFPDGGVLVDVVEEGVSKMLVAEERKDGARRPATAWSETHQPLQARLLARPGRVPGARFEMKRRKYPTPMMTGTGDETSRAPPPPSDA